jgi:hypothetical protein
MTPPISTDGDDVNEITIDGEQIQEVTTGGDVVWTTSSFPPSDATAAYDFESGSGDTVVDRTGNGNDGSVTGGMSWTTNTQYGDYAGSFDGTYDLVNCGSIFGSQSVQEAEFRLYPQSTSRAGVFGQVGSWRVLYNWDGNQSIEIKLDTDEFNHGLSMATDTWHHVYGKWDKGNEIVIDINGDRRSARTSEFGSSNEDTVLGKISSGYYLVGRLDNVAFAQGSSAVLGS